MTELDGSPSLEHIKTTLTAWGDSLAKELPVGGLLSRNRTAHKWKAPHRSLILRETVAWRTQDLLSQSVFLHEKGSALGARILLRSAFESVAVLVYLNQLTRSVLAGTLDFHNWSDKTTVLLLGSRNKSTPLNSINIVTILEKSNARYPSLAEMYARLSESAHPNYEGISIGYSDIDHKNYVTNFSNKWAAMYGRTHLIGITTCMMTFELEYNTEWTESFELLEKWLVSNDEMLEATKSPATNK